MQTVFLVLLLVAAVVVANAVYARFNQIPVAFLQIGAGLILSLIPLYRNFELQQLLQMESGLLEKKNWQDLLREEQPRKKKKGFVRRNGR